MEFINILAIAVALAMDAFAVAIATGVALKDDPAVLARRIQALK